jgi:hypothetical protein
LTKFGAGNELFAREMGSILAGFFMTPKWVSLASGLVGCLGRSPQWQVFFPSLHDFFHLCHLKKIKLNIGFRV